MKLLNAIIDLFFPREAGDDRSPPKGFLFFVLILLFILLWGTCK